MLRTGELHRSEHQVRPADEEEWMIPIHVPGLVPESSLEYKRGLNDDMDIDLEPPPILLPKITYSDYHKWKTLVTASLYLGLIILASMTLPWADYTAFTIKEKAITLQLVSRWIIIPFLGFYLLQQYMFCSWVFKAWTIILSQKTVLNPKQAAWLTGIPVVNIVTNFYTLYLWADEYNRLISKHPQLKRLSRARSTTFTYSCIVPCCLPLFVVLALGLANLLSNSPLQHFSYFISFAIFILLAVKIRLKVGQQLVKHLNEVRETVFQKKPQY